MFNESLEIWWKTAHFCIFISLSKITFVWAVISSIRHSVSSLDETPRSSSKILRCASYFQLYWKVFHVVMKRWNTASHALYMTQKSQHRLNYQRNSSSCLIISFMYQQNSHVFQRIFIKLGLRAVFWSFHSCRPRGPVQHEQETCCYGAFSSDQESMLTSRRCSPTWGCWRPRT